MDFLWISYPTANAKTSFSFHESDPRLFTGWNHLNGLNGQLALQGYGDPRGSQSWRI
jgi:hypothetical protein